MDHLKLLIESHEAQEKLGNLTSIGVAYLNGLRRAYTIIKTK